MRIAVLVGNGFDLSLGLETSPDAFLAEFVKENVHREDASDNRSAADSHPGERLAKTIAVEGLKAWSAYEEKIGEYSKEYSLENVEDYFDEIDALQQFLTVWLSGEDERITEEFIKKNAGPCLKSLAKFQDALPVRQKEAISALYAAHKSEDRAFDILCFNYTSALRRMYDSLGGEGAALAGLSGNRAVRLGKFIYVHDSLKGVPVTGVNDVEQIANPDIAGDSRACSLLIKGEIQSSVLHKNDDSLGLSIIATAKLIVVFGMSFGKCDRRWWEKVLGRMRADKEVLLVLYVFSQDKVRLTPLTLLRREASALRSLLDGAGFDSIDDIVDRIIVADSKSLFPVVGKAQPKVAVD